MARVETLPRRTQTEGPCRLRSLNDLKTPNFAVLSIMTRQQLDAAERRFELEAVSAKTLGKKIGASQWLSAIRSERTKRGQR